MSFSVLGSFILSALILALAPGPDNIFVLTQSALYGVKKGLLVIVGLCLGIVLQTLLMIVGVTAFITAVPILMVLLKLLGVAYLSYLAYMAITHAKAVPHLAPAATAPAASPASSPASSPAASPATATAPADAAAQTEASDAAKDNAAAAAQAEAEPSATATHQLPAPPELTSWRLVRRGFIMNITNPKVQLFFLSFFPQFLPSDLRGFALMSAMALLGCLFALATLMVFAAIAVGSGRLSAHFASPTFNMWLNYSAAIIFLSLALLTLYSACTG